MVKVIFLLGVILAAFVAGSTCQKPYIILPTYRPPPQKPVIIRTVREAKPDEPQWLNQGDIPRAPATADHPYLPKYIDDIKLDPNRRYVRSLDSPSAKRGGGSSHTTSGRNHDTGATHPGYNRRNARDIWLPEPSGPFRPFPSPTFPDPDPFNPRPYPTRRPFPIYARTTRDLHIPALKKPTYRDVIIPNWNPNVRTSPWERIGGKPRNPRSVEMLDSQEGDAVGLEY